MSILYGILGLGLVILIHEAGHFFAARAVGIEVEVFSIGWGKKLIGFKKGLTEYRISMIPLGGFVKMKGETAYQQAREDGREEIPREKNSFFQASPWHRIIVAAAGPAMNLLFAIFVLSLINLFGFNYSSFSNKIIVADDFPAFYSLPEGSSPAAQAGLQTGDRVIAVNGNDTSNFTLLQREIAPRALETVSLTVLRGDRQFSVEASLILNQENGAGVLGVFPFVETIIAAPINDAVSGLQPNDKILAINDTEIQHSYDLRAAMDLLPPSKEQAFVDLSILREGDNIIVRHPLLYDEETQLLSLGYYYTSETYKKTSGGLFQAIADGGAEAFATLSQTFKGLGLLFRGLNPTSALSGPIRITMLVGEVTAQGLSLGLAEGVRSFFHLLSLLSVALFFGNLLPIPVLDGGQIVMCIVEIIKRSPISPKTFFRYQTFGAAIVISLIIFVLFSDLLFVLGSNG